MKLYHYHGACNLAGSRIRQARERLGLSQEQLALRVQLKGLEVNQKTISRIETGLRVIPDYELPFYAEALEVSIGDLLRLSDDQSH